MVVLGFVPGPALNLVRPPAHQTLQQVHVQDVPAASAEGSNP
jgi:NADH-quinone oxidoreductase subunit M